MAPQKAIAAIKRCSRILELVFGRGPALERKKFNFFRTIMVLVYTRLRRVYIYF